MKGHISMLEMCREKAESAGIRAFKGWCGIFVTSDEMEVIYARESFNVAPGRTVHKRHVQNWERIGEAYGMDMDMTTVSPFAVWFDIPDCMLPSLAYFLETHLMPEERAIKRVQWPFLQELGIVSAPEMIE